MADAAFQLADEEEADLRPLDLRVAWRLAPFVRPHIRLLIAGLLAVLGATAVGLCGPKLLGRAVDAMGRGDVDALTWAAGLLGAVQVSAFLLRWAQGHLLATLGQRVLLDLRVVLFAHLQRQALSFFQRWPVGRLVSRVSSDVETLAELFSVGVVTILGDLATIVGVSAVLLATHWVLGLHGLAAIPALLLLVLGFRRSIRRASRTVRRRVALLAAFVTERLQGIRVVRAFGAEREDRARFRAVNGAALEAYDQRTHLDALHNPGVHAITAGAVALVLWRGGEAAAAGEITPGTLIELIAYLTWLYQPIRDLAAKYTLLQQAAASSERIVELLDLEEAVADPVDPEPLPEPLRGEVELRDVRFSYLAAPPTAPPTAPKAPLGDAPCALDGVSLHVRAGETVAIVGATGAGKSSVANLVFRLWDPQEGQVLLDGVDLRRLRQRDLRRRVALVLQDVFLFAGTIGENIALGDDGSGQGVGRAQVERAARAVAAHEVIERLGGYDAVLEERGQTLSQGERQLISFARALARDPAVLVLDEATANIDPETEARLQAGVRALCAGRTAIVIAHRLATVRHADRIVVLHRGRVAEVGSHDELVTMGGIYARLVELQLMKSE